MAIAKRYVAVMLWTALVALAPSARAASTTDYTDQYFIANEAGWGAAAVQQGSTLFINLFVYGPDARSTWFVVAAYYQDTTAQGHLVFSGDLYTSTGPWFGAAFDPAAVVGRKVGTLTFDADSVTTATITYTVDGVAVVKNVVRQSWASENISGSYYGGFILNFANCSNPALRGGVEELGALQVFHNLNTFAVSIDFQSTNGVNCSFAGSYSQNGHMGRVIGTYTCTDGTTGNFHAFEIEKTVSGMTGRVFGDNQYCSYTGRFGGLLR